MDFQGFVNTFTLPCAILSVEKLSERHYGEIRIVKANDIYKETMGVARYHDNMLYSDLVPKDVKFENFCYRAAVLKQRLHSYIPTPGLNCWSDIMLLPMNCSEGNLSYCAFYYETTRDAEPERLSKVSLTIAQSVIKTCLNLQGNPNFQDGITNVIEDIQSQADAFCSAILLLNQEERSYSVLCEKFKNNAYHVSDYGNTLTYDIVASWEKTIGKSNGIIVTNNIDMEQLRMRNPLWVSSLKEASVTSVILYPLLHAKKTLGYLFVTNFDIERVVELKELLELTSYFISAEVASQMLFEKLEHLSNTDLLTGVKNRSAMNLRVDLFVRGEEIIPHPYGIIFCCVSGLKKMNDENGHDAGDILLKKAASLLKDIFRNDEIYRSGGDEFVVIVPTCQEDEFKKKVAELRSKSRYDSETALAIGASWNDEGYKLRRSMHFADEAMHKDKEKFYTEHPEFLR